MGREYAQIGKREYAVWLPDVSGSLIWHAIANSRLNNYSIADSLLKLKLEESKRTGNAFDLGTIYDQLAHVQLTKGNSTEALNYFNKAFVIEKKQGHDVNCKGVLNNI